MDRTSDRGRDSRQGSASGCSPTLGSRRARGRRSGTGPAIDGKACARGDRGRPGPGRFARTCPRPKTCSRPGSGRSVGPRTETRVRRRQLVSAQCWAKAQCRSALAAAAHLPLRPRGPDGDRRDPHRCHRKLLPGQRARHSRLHQGASASNHFARGPGADDRARAAPRSGIELSAGVRAPKAEHQEKAAAAEAGLGGDLFELLADFEPARLGRLQLRGDLGPAATQLAHRQRRQLGQRRRPDRTSRGRSPSIAPAAGRSPPRPRRPPSSARARPRGPSRAALRSRFGASAWLPPSAGSGRARSRCSPRCCRDIPPRRRSRPAPAGRRSARPCGGRG